MGIPSVRLLAILRTARRGVNRRPCECVQAGKRRYSIITASPLPEPPADVFVGCVM
jgi:hypothetical protein